MPHPPLRGAPPTASYAPPRGREMPPPFHYQNEHYSHPQGQPPPPPPQRYHPNNSMRMPPPHYPEPYQGPPQPTYHRSERGYGPPGPWREEPLRHAPSYPPRYEYRRDVPPHPEEHYHAPRGPPPALYMPHMHHPSAREGPPPMRMAPRTVRPPPEPQFKRSPDSPTNTKLSASSSSDLKKQSSTKDSKGRKKGDALDLLAKVSSAMTEDEESEGGGTEATNTSEKPAQQMTPPRPMPSPPKSHMYTPSRYIPERDAARQITPNTDQRRPYTDAYARHHPRDPYGPRDFYPPFYPRSHSPPAVISQRNSFEESGNMCQEVVYYEGAEIMDIDPPPHHYERYPPRQEHYPPHLPPPPLPYTFVQQPRLENKTILRKKFSWKHYPELERFLIANRDEYLRHSALNYTAEQKQYNNWLTERLLELAARHHYMFDAEEFNFVAVRDRIRCYYKSYVQTTRKRGQPMAIKKKMTMTSAGASE